MFNKILIAAALVFVLAVLFIGGQRAVKDEPPLQNGAALGAFQLSESFFDFGTISMRAGKVSREFTLTNATTAPLVIEQVSTSCMCTEAFVGDGDSRKGPYGMPGHGYVPPVNVSVDAGKTAPIEVFFDPAAHGPAGVGKIERAVFIEDNGGNRSTIVIRAFVTP